MSDFSPTPIDQCIVVSSDERRMVILNPNTGEETVLEAQANEDHLVIQGTTVDEGTTEDKPFKPESHKDHKKLRDLGIFVVSAYAVTSIGNALILHKGAQGPVDTYQMLAQVPGFYLKWINFIGKFF